MNLRIDQQIISDWIPDGARVLDLGCGNGALLNHLQQRNISGYGLEIEPKYCSSSGALRKLIGCSMNSAHSPPWSRAPNI